MKPFGIFLIAALLSSFAPVFSTHAEEVPPPEGVPAAPSKSLLEELGFPSREERMTLESLEIAWNQESKDQVRYLAFADKADEEGQPENGKILRLLARAKQTYLDHYAETIQQLGGATPAGETGKPTVKSTAENLRSVLESETYKGKTMYPSFLDQPHRDGPGGTSKFFQNARMASESQAGFLQEILATSPSKIPVSAYNICLACGFVFLEWAEIDTCPICGAPKERFKKIVEA